MRLTYHQGQARFAPRDHAAGDGAHVGEAESLQVQGRQRGAATGAADQDERPLLVRQGGVADMRDGGVRIDLELQHAARDVDGSGDVAGLEFGGFAHVDHDGAARGFGEGPGIDFANLPARFRHEVGHGARGRHGHS